MTRVCTKCKVEKPIEAFCSNVRARGGRNTQCKECINAANRRLAGGVKVGKPRNIFIDVNKEPGYVRAIQTLHDFGPMTQGALERKLKLRDGALCSKLITLTLTEDPLLCNGKEYVLAEDENSLLCLVERGGVECISLSP